MRIGRWLIASLLTGIVVAFYAVIIWFMLASQPAQPNATDKITYDLQSGTSVSEISHQLQEKNIIRSSLAFQVYVTLHGLRGQLEAGSYDLDPSGSLGEVAQTLSGGRTTANKLLIPEGSTVAQIMQRAVDHGIDEQDFQKALGATYSNNFLAGRPSGDTSLEGYLFPDTYDIIRPPNPQAMVQAMLDNFAAKINGSDIAQSYAAEGLSLHQGVTLASMVQKEAAKTADMPMIASVFMNRLHAGTKLQSDPTVSYGAALLGKNFDTSLNSPYNTYVVPGLPLGPICNPGLDALKAAAHPAQTDYLYFIADKQGNVHYEKTAAEHTADVKKYLGQ